MPFVAVVFYDGDEDVKKAVTSFLVGSIITWTLLNIAFFSSIDLSYLKTFFTTKTAPQYTCELFLESEADSAKFRAAFKNRHSYTTSINEQVKEWVENNIVRWKEDQPAWFKIEKIPDDLLPSHVLELEGGGQRRRSSVVASVKEIVGLRVPQESAVASLMIRQSKEAWKKLAESIYESRSKGFNENVTVVERIFGEIVELLKPLMDRCPTFAKILAHILLNKMGFRAREVDWTSEMVDWGEEESRRVGRSFANFLRQRKTGEVAVDAWRKQYQQLEILFEEVIGFEDFVVTLANSLLKDSIYGTVFRVSVGAALSTIDAATDIFVITTYYQSDALVGQARALLSMITTNIVVQIITVLAQYQKKSLAVKLKEVLISLFFLRPAVDAYRVSTNHEDNEAAYDSLTDMIMNKGIELATESIPGCMLQLYVWLNSPEQVGTLALTSIAISAMTTGFTSAMIAFDMDVDIPHGKVQPKFYGYLPVRRPSERDRSNTRRGNHMAYSNCTLGDNVALFVLKRSVPISFS